MEHETQAKGTRKVTGKCQVRKINKRRNKKVSKEQNRKENGQGK